MRPLRYETCMRMNSYWSGTATFDRENVLAELVTGWEYAFLGAKMY